MLRHFGDATALATRVALVAGVALVVSSTGCATKGFVPRVISESVIVRGENARPGSPDVRAKAHESRSKPAAKARPGARAPRRVDGRPVGTRGLNGPDADAIGPVAATSGDSGADARDPKPDARASGPPVTPAATKKASTSYASMAGGGWLLGLALAGVVACVVVYRRRPFRVY